MDPRFPLYVPKDSPVTRGQHSPRNSLTNITQGTPQIANPIPSGRIGNTASRQEYLHTSSNIPPQQQHLQATPNIALPHNYCNSFVPESVIQDDSMLFPNNSYSFHQPPLMPSSYADTVYDTSNTTPYYDNQDATGSMVGCQSEAHTEPVRKCKWEGCKYSGSFSRKRDLERHVISTHISPGAYICPSAGCGKSFGREDVMKTHQRTHQNTGTGMSFQD